MKQDTKLALAAALIALAAELTNEETPASAAAPAPTSEPAAPATPPTDKPRRGRPPASEKPPEPVKEPEQAAPATEEKKPEQAASAATTETTIDDMRALVQPLVKCSPSRIGEVKRVIAKYAETMIKMEPKDYPAFETDINALLAGKTIGEIAPDADDV